MAVATEQVMFVTAATSVSMCTLLSDGLSARGQASEQLKEACSFSM